MKRYKHSLSHFKLTTFDMGKLIPVGLFEVLPGDSIQQATSALIRVNPLVAPVMHPVQVRIHHWFVPNRLVWANWENFITGGTDGEGDGAVWPFRNDAFVANSLDDYFGLPVGPNINVSVLPFRAYNLIWNEFYRDQDLQTALNVSTADGDDNTYNRVVQSIAWEKDYFTSARPWPQKGPEVTLPLGTAARVYGDGNIATGNARMMSDGTSRNIQTAAGVTDLHLSGAAAAGPVAVPWSAVDQGLYADLTTATAVSVNAVREAFALQRFEEARAMYGSRYTEYLRYLGVRSSDARLQRPEYLGGGKQTIAFSEVLQTAPTTGGSQLGVADLKGHGIAAMRSNRYRRFFEEHGLVMSLMSVRPRTIYRDGVDRMWSRDTKEDYWQKELEMIGQQEILNQEVYGADSAPTDVFGYQDRYAEYRHLRSGIAGAFRTTLNYWHLARLFAADQTLNASFIASDPSNRIYAAPVADANLLAMVSHSIQARRPVTKSGTPGRIV